MLAPQLNWDGPAKDLGSNEESDWHDRWHELSATQVGCNIQGRVKWEDPFLPENNTDIGRKPELEFDARGPERRAPQSSKKRDSRIQNNFAGSKTR